MLAAARSKSKHNGCVWFESLLLHSFLSSLQDQDFILCIFLSQAQEAAVRASNAPRDDQQDLDKMLSSLGVAPVSGKLCNYISVFIGFRISYMFVHKLIILCFFSKRCSEMCNICIILWYFCI